MTIPEYLQNINSKDRELSFEDILHYQQIIVALMETGEVDGGGNVIN